MNADYGGPSDESAGVDVDALVEGGFNLLIGRRLDGTWHVSRGNRNTRLRQRAITASGATLEDALRALESAVRNPQSAIA